MAGVGFAEHYVQGALITGDFQMSTCVLVGSSPGFGWGIVPAEAFNMEGLTRYPFDAPAPADETYWGFVRFPYSMFDDTDESIAACVYTFGTGDGLELWWPDEGTIRNSIPVAFRDDLSAEVAAAAGAVEPGPVPNRPAAGRGAGGAGDGVGRPQAAGRGRGGEGRGAPRTTVATLAGQLSELVQSVHGIYSAVSALGARMDRYEHRADPPLVGPVSGAPAVDEGDLLREAALLPGVAQALNATPKAAPHN